MNVNSALWSVTLHLLLSGLILEVTGFIPAELTEHKKSTSEIPIV